MLTAGDDDPLHQCSEPFAFAGTDRIFCGRSFFNGQSSDGRRLFAAAPGVFPHRNTMDAAFSVRADEVRRSVFASHVMDHERMATAVGPRAVEVVEPLKRLRVRLETSDGMAADLLATGLHPPVEEPRFIRRVGARTLMDRTRLTRNMRWQGVVTIDGRAHDVEGLRGTRDRSGGARPIGAADPQPLAPPVAPQFFWLWAPVVFEGLSLPAHTDDDGEGQPWNRSAVPVENASGTATVLRHGSP